MLTGRAPSSSTSEVAGWRGLNNSSSQVDSAYLGHAAAFLSLACEGLVALVILALFLPETKEKLPI
jgi:hypothetical protein